MVLPTKHIAPENSVIGIGAMMLLVLEEGDDYDTLHDKCEKHYMDKFDRTAPTAYFMRALDWLMVMGIIRWDDNKVYLTNAIDPETKLGEVKDIIYNREDSSYEEIVLELQDIL